MVRMGIAVALLALAGTGARAQDAYCIAPGRGVDPDATSTLAELMQQADPELMQALVGTWRTQRRAPATGQMQDIEQTFEPGGLFGYRDHTCGADGSCSDGEGTGLYAVRAGDGGFFGLIVVSDLHRDHECVSLRGRFVGGRTVETPDGGIWQRVR